VVLELDDDDDDDISSASPNAHPSLSPSEHRLGTFDTSQKRRGSEGEIVHRRWLLLQGQARQLFLLQLYDRTTMASHRQDGSLEMIAITTSISAISLSPHQDLKHRHLNPPALLILVGYTIFKTSRKRPSLWFSRWLQTPRIG
jgi:hypothetical protein